MGPRYVDTDGVSQAFGTLSDALADITFPLTEDETVYVAASTGLADTPVTIPDTGSGYKLFVIDPIVRSEYDDAGYRIETSDSSQCVASTTSGHGSASNFVIRNLQLRRTTATASNQYIILISGVRSGNISFENCLIMGHPTQVSNHTSTLVRSVHDSRYTAVLSFLNCVFMATDGAALNAHFDFGATFAPGNTFIHNCSLVSGNTVVHNARVEDRGNIYVRNCIVTDAAPGVASGGNVADCVWGADFDDTGYTLWSDNQINADLSGTFVDAAGGDYQLSSGDVIARDSGVDLSDHATAPVTDDKLGVSRPQGSGWDIGAFEYVDVLPLPRLFYGKPQPMS